MVAPSSVGLLTIACLTNRRDCRIKWFFDSLHRECGGDYSGLRVVVVDFFACGQKPQDEWTDYDALCRRAFFRELCGCHNFVHTPPIWDAWQGPYRLTRDNWSAKCNYLNAAVCLTPGDYMASVDDLSVLSPGWLKAARQAAEFDGITCGAYRKVKDMVVEDGVLVSFTDHPSGRDPRWDFGSSTPTTCRGNRMYGCTFVAPIRPLLEMNGWPAGLCNSHGFEDVTTGLVLARNGVRFLYDRNLMTYESEELHFKEKPFRREDYGKSPNDMSHAILAHCENPATRRFDNFGAEGLAGVRERVLSGQPLPVVSGPLYHWYTKTPLADLV